MDEPVKASDIEKVSEADEDTIASKRRKRAVESRLAKRAAMKKVGADTPTGVGSPDLHENLARRTERSMRDSTTRFKARKAAEEALDRKRRESK